MQASSREMKYNCGVLGLIPNEPSLKSFIRLQPSGIPSSTRFAPSHPCKSRLTVPEQEIALFGSDIIKDGVTCN